MRLRNFQDILENGNAKKIYQRLKEEGYTDNQIAGVIGNLMQESYAELNPKAENAKSKAFGIAQWKGSRRQDLENMFPETYDTLDSQIEFLIAELNSTEKRAKQDLLKTDNIINATRSFFDKYERAGEDEAKMESRLGYAMNIADKISEWRKQEEMEQMRQEDLKYMEFDNVAADNTSTQGMFTFGEDYFQGERLPKSDGSIKADMYLEQRKAEIEAAQSKTEKKWQ